jgi:hypothetical protein
MGHGKEDTTYQYTKHEERRHTKMMSNR